MKVFETKITRHTEAEAKQAIADLEERGFIIHVPLTERKKIGSSKSDYCYRKAKYTSRQPNLSSSWYAVMRKVKNA